MDEQKPTEKTMRIGLWILVLGTLALLGIIAWLAYLVLTLGV